MMCLPTERPAIATHHLEAAACRRGRPWTTGTRRGVVLIVVLVLVVMVALAGFGFLAAMSTEYEAARLNGSLLQAQQTLASAESLLLWFGALSDQERERVGGSYHNPVLFRGRLTDGPLSAAGMPAADATSLMPASTDNGPVSAATGEDGWRFSIISTETLPTQSRILRFGIENESGKLHLATVLRWEQAEAGQGRRALLQLPGMTDAIADAILDWMDADDSPRESGAESDYYQLLDKPCRAANAVPRRLTELLHVRGVTRQLLLGAWAPFLTVDSAERQQSRGGQPRVFLNSGNLASLEQQLGAVLPEEIVRYILLARVYGVTRGTEQGMQPMEAPYSASLTPAFTLSSMAELVDTFVRISTAAGPLIVQSPLQPDHPDFANQLATVLSQTTTQPESVVRGRINVLTAPETVLRTIPGMTAELASQVILARNSLTSADSTSLAWLLTGNVLDMAVFRQVFPEITTGGDVFQTEIVVFRSVGGPLLRRKLIIDTASTPGRRLHWTDVTTTRLPCSLQQLMPTML